MERDGLRTVALEVEPEVLSDTRATARVVRLRTNASRTGCNDWSGTYELRKIGDTWRISKADLERSDADGQRARFLGGLEHRFGGRVDRLAMVKSAATKLRRRSSSLAHVTGRRP